MSAEFICPVRAAFNVCQGWPLVGTAAAQGRSRLFYLMARSFPGPHGVRLIPDVLPSVAEKQDHFLSSFFSLLFLNSTKSWTREESINKKHCSFVRNFDPVHHLQAAKFHVWLIFFILGFDYDRHSSLVVVVTHLEMKEGGLLLCAACQLELFMFPFCCAE